MTVTSVPQASKNWPASIYRRPDGTLEQDFSPARIREIVQSGDGELWVDIENYTGGDGYLDKLCMELVGLPSSRNRPPTRDVRHLYREKARQMLIAAGVPNVVGTGSAAAHAQREVAAAR